MHGEEFWMKSLLVSCDSIFYGFWLKFPLVSYDSNPFALRSQISGLRSLTEISHSPLKGSNYFSISRRCTHRQEPARTPTILDEDSRD